MSRKHNEALIASNPFVGALHDTLLDSNLSVAEAFEDAVCWLAEIYAQNQLLARQIELGTSSGFLRKDTSNLRWKPKQAATPVDDGDAWVRAVD